MENVKNLWSTGIGKLLMLGVLGGVVTLCFFLGSLMFGGNTPESPSESEPELSATQTQPVATDTPVRPTATATPTDTPLPDTAVPTSSPVGSSSSSTSSPYLDEVNVGFQAYQNAFANVDDYIQESTTDFNVLLNEDWKQKTGSALSQLDEAAKQLESIDNAPPEYEQLDMYLKSIAGETYELVDNYGNGVDQLDPNAINSALSNLTNITSYMNNASTELDKYFNP